MKKKIITKGLLRRLIDASFTVTETENDIEFGKYSPAGQDFHFIVNKDEISDLNDLQDKLYDQYNDFDVSYETYLCLDNTGHGKGGAPYDMDDIYNDMSACQEYIEEARKIVYEYDQRKYI